MSAVAYTLKNTVAILTIDSPPVNAIGAAVRSGIVDGIAQANADDNAKTIIIICAGRTFMAGADIREFGKPPVEPHLPDVCATIEASTKPVIAAIHGNALGGGLEIALGAHYRIALSTAKVGLPEVNLGLIPGAGGTQRLPRLIGATKAINIITSGTPVAAPKAAKMGIIDQICDDDLLEHALAYADAVADVDFSARRLSTQNVEPVEAGFIDAKRTELAKRRRGFEAPQACVNSVENAATLPFDEGLKRERALFLECRASTQSKAQQHMFFAERESLKVDDISRDTPARDIQRVAIIGAGTMGGGIAICFADAGFDVTLLEINPDALKAGLARIDKNYAGMVAKGRISEDVKNDRLNRITGTTNYDDLSDVDLVVEAAFESMDVKAAIFQELERVTKPSCILASNTSYLDVDDIAATVSRSQDVIGLHFFSPANIMKLLEIVRAKHTATDVMQTMLKLAKRLGKIGVVSGVCHGFIGNRMYQHYQREVGLLLLDGATPSQIDAALLKFGMPMGPCAVGDLSGLDIGYAMRKSLTDDQFEAKAFMVHNKLVEMDRKGQKTQAGFYDYPDGARRGTPSDLVEKLIKDTAADLKIPQRQISDDEIVERCIYALVNAGGHILDEGIAARASDIDVVFVNGYGFPRWRGGPMHYAATVGFKKVSASIDGFASNYGDRWWSPSQWLSDQK